MSSMENTQKFKRGYRVRILSRLPPGETERYDGRWQNTGEGLEAIVEFSNLERTEIFQDYCIDTYEDTTVYSLFVLFGYDQLPRSVKWYEEKYLELICCNEVKGEKILRENHIP